MLVVEYGKRFFLKKRIISKKHVTIDFKVRDSQEEMRHREVDRKIMIRDGEKKRYGNSKNTKDLRNKVSFITNCKNDTFLAKLKKHKQETEIDF